MVGERRADVWHCSYSSASPRAIWRGGRVCQASGRHSGTGGRCGHGWPRRLVGVRVGRERMVVRPGSPCLYAFLVNPAPRNRCPLVLLLFLKVGPAEPEKIS